MSLPCFLLRLRQAAAVLLVIVLILVGATALHAQVRGETRIQPYAGNPFYWQYQGEPVLLLGGSEDEDMHNWSGTQLTDHLDLLVSNGGNFLREVATSDDSTSGVYAFKQISTGTYDLDQWDEQWWSRMDNLLYETHQRGIIVSVEIWNGWSFVNNAWDISHWNPKNNVNYTAADTGMPEEWTTLPYKGDSPFVRTVPGQNNVPQVLAYQEKFVRRLLQTTLNYDNAIYVIQNESETNWDWPDYWAAFLHNEAAALGEEVEVADMRGKWDLTDAAHAYPIERPNLYTFADISQNNTVPYSNTQIDQLHYDRIQFMRDKIQNDATLGGGPAVVRPINNAKIYGADGARVTFGTTEEAIERFWRNVFGGAASARFHRTGAGPYGLGLTAIAQAQILSARQVTDAIDIFAMEPRNDLLSNRTGDEAYVLADVGREYAIYFPGDGDGAVTLNLHASPKDMWIQWFDLDMRIWEARQPLLGGGTVSLQRPGGGSWAVLIGVPEPTTLLLLAFVGLGLAIRRCRP